VTTRFFPRSLAGQLSILLVAAVLVAQTLTTLIFAESRRSAIDAATREQVLGRMAALARLLEEVPPAQYDRILAAAGSARIVYTIAPEPSVDPDSEASLDDATRTKLEEIFGTDRLVKIALAAPPRHGRLMRPPPGPGDDHGPPDGGDRPGFGPGSGLRLRLPVLAVSVQLAGGNWLNSETLLPSPGLWAWPTIVSTLLMAITIVLVVLVTVRRITQPLRQLALASDRLGRGEAVVDLPEAGPEEIVRANRAFNAMQGRVRRFVADRTRMIAAISHDLRTPLTALRLRAEFIDDDDTRERIIGSVDEMTRMSEATLAFARDDASQEETRSTDLAALVAAVTDDFADLGHDVTITGPDRLEATVRPVALRRAVRNLVENAIRYGVRARVGLERGNGEIRIRVDDDGPGIPEDRMEEVFAPFTRLEGSRNQETGGVGLGLSTARSVIHAHGGELRLANRPGGGLTATIHLPLAAER
jgi:signal transduction histidine kinase